MTCNCEFTPDPDDPEEESRHFLRTCLSCHKEWWALHCPHDGYQNPCHSCGVRPEPVASLSLDRRALGCLDCSATFTDDDQGRDALFSHTCQ